MPKRRFDPTHLRQLLTRLEIEECRCPPYLSCPCGQECPEGVRDSCRHCREECDCPPLLHQPPCRHVARAVDPADLFQLVEEYRRHFPAQLVTELEDMRAALLRLAWPLEYSEPPRGLPERAVSREDRVDVMFLRFRHGLAVEHPRDTWRRRTSEVGILVARLRNGAVVENGVVRG